MCRPASGRQVERGGANVRFQLGRSSAVVEPERLGVDRPAPNKNGQATPGPAVLVESCIDIYDQILSQERPRSEEHTSELQSRVDLVCRLLLEKKKKHYSNQRRLYIII